MTGRFASKTRRRLMLCISTTVVGLVVACSSLSETSTPERADPGQAECQDRILVVVWGDLDRDGIQDPGEPPLADVLLMMAQEDDPPGEGIQLSTGADGKAYFPTRELENCSPIGYKVLFLRQVAGYEFPSDPVADLDDHDPHEDIVRFGLLPLSENQD